MGGEEYAKLGVERLDRHEARLGLRQRQRPGQLRDRARHLRRARSSTASPAARPTGREVKLWFPGGSSSPVLTERRPRPPLRLRLDGQGRLDARLRRDHRRRRLELGRRRRAEARRSSTATSRCGKCTPCREGTNWTVKMLERIDAGEATPMDLDIMASVQEQHHRQLPVRARRRDGDAGRLDDREVPRRVRGAHRGRARRATSWRRPSEAPPEAADPGGGRLMPRPEPRDDHLHDRRPRGHRAREHDARRRRQARRRRDPRLLLRAQARRARRRLPHVPRRDRGHPEAADRLLDAGQGRHGRPHADRPRQARPRRRSSSSCSSTTRSTARSATRAASARCRTSPSAGAAGARASSSPSATSRSRSRSSPLIAIDRERCILCYRCVRFSQEISEDYQLVLAGARRPHLRRRRSTATPTSRRSAATSSSCARSAR